SKVYGDSYAQAISTATASANNGAQAFVQNTGQPTSGNDYNSIATLAGYNQAKSGHDDFVANKSAQSSTAAYMTGYNAA
ncbi:hypothetical protein ACKXGD_19070, partial [Enterococcus lactis]|uniref:hypothetical protein n=1 Tax=Enterococcus lactis TaxID=357441 RepID=UPI00390806D3